MTSCEDRFRAKVKADPSGCWLWTARRNEHGYGEFRNGGRAQLAHRVAWELEHGPVPDGISVCHTCDTPACVRPSHLWLGTHAQNMADMRRKQRAATGPAHVSRCAPDRLARGERVPQHVLTADDVRAIRAVGISRRGQAAALARQYGVASGTVRRAARGISWRHV